MELKYGTHKIPGGINCSNRTFMELKSEKEYWAHRDKKF